MRRVFILCVAGLLVMAPVSVLAQGTSPAKPATPQAKAPEAKTMSATGTVSAVTADSLTVKAKTEEMTFTIDSKTNVIGRGVGTKSAALKGEGKPTVITEFVKVGDSVTVRYRDSGTAKLASSVRVTSSKAPAK